MKNPFEVFEKENSPKEIQKSEIFGALRNYNNPMRLKKTGKEIKEQINKIILPFLNQKKEEIQLQLSNFLENTSFLPTSPCYSRIEINESEFPYKQYNWEETNYVEKSFGKIFKGFGEIDVNEEMPCLEGECCKEEIKIYSPQSKEEAESRSKYNQLVNDLRDIIIDIKTANVLVNTLKDNDEYFLDIDQLVSLKFEEE